MIYVQANVSHTQEAIGEWAESIQEGAEVRCTEKENERLTKRNKTNSYCHQNYKNDFILIQHLFPFFEGGGVHN